MMELRFYDARIVGINLGFYDARIVGM